MKKLLDIESENLSGELQLTNGFKVNCFKIPFGDPDGEWLDHLWIKPYQSGAIILTREAKPFMGQFKDRECHLSDHYGGESIIEI